ncbi:hypothetical protein PR048_012688 [Dryococelus australis]|uniref:Uncharacterized protein n=1 Tax=Dryococelus australis TaxID=614101 RepID=A0ABQ9HQH0_9NEOP|nr:hypothetical protein PR048_012688 [Dryococelus australis]
MSSTQKSVNYEMHDAVLGTYTCSPSKSGKEHAPMQGNVHQVMVADISPLPGLSNKAASLTTIKTNKRKSRKQKSETLTTTSLKEKHEEIEKKRENNKRMKEAKIQDSCKETYKKCMKPGCKRCRRQLKLSEGESETELINEKDLCNDDNNYDIEPFNRECV